MALKRMDNVGIVVENLDAAIDFFRELGLNLEGRAMIDGAWAGRVTGLADQQVEIAMMRTPDGHSRLELSRFLRPAVIADHRQARSTRWVICASCSRWTTSTRRWTSSGRGAHNWSATSSITRTYIGSATSAGRKGF